MRKGYCIDCREITYIKAQNRCESHYRKHYYRQHRVEELVKAGRRRYKNKIDHLEKKLFELNDKLYNLYRLGDEQSFKDMQIVREEVLREYYALIDLVNHPPSASLAELSAYWESDKEG